MSQCSIQPAEATYRKPSCRRKSARLVPLLQNLIAYDNVLIVAAWPGGLRMNDQSDMAQSQSDAGDGPWRTANVETAEVDSV